MLVAICLTWGFLLWLLQAAAPLFPIWPVSLLLLLVSAMCCLQPSPWPQVPLVPQEADPALAWF